MSAPFRLLPNRAIVVVDPVSSGLGFKDCLQDPDVLPVAVYTLTEAELGRAGKPLPPGERQRGWRRVLDGKDATATLENLRRLGVPVAGVIAGSEPGVALAEFLAANLGVPGNPPETTALRRDKGAMRLATQAAGLANPSFLVCTDAAQAVRFAEACSYPVMVKALASAGTDHVYTCQTAFDVAAAADRALGAVDIFGARIEAVIVEEFVYGVQYGVELMACNGGHVVTSIWEIAERPTPEWNGMFQSISLLDDGATRPGLAAIRDYAIAVCRTLQIQVGPALVELRLNPERGPVLIEACARPSGLDAPRLLAHASTLDPLQTAVEILSGTRTTLPSPAIVLRKVHIVFVPIAEDGEVVAVEGLVEIALLPSFYEGKVMVAPGSRVGKTRDQATFAARYVLVHPDSTQVARDEARLRDLFRLRVANRANEQDANEQDAVACAAAK